MDANSWEKREERFSKKFEIGRKHIPTLFTGFELPPVIEQIALIGFGSAPGREQLGGGRLVMIGTFMRQIRDDLAHRNIAANAVPEQFYLLRTLQFAAHHW
jgi:hypothetical protein